MGSSRRRLVRLLVPVAIAIVGSATGQWGFAAIGIAGVMLVIALRVWASAFPASSAFPGGVVMTFAGVAVAFLAAAIYLFSAVGGATAWIIGVMALFVAFGAAYMGYGVALVATTGRRPRGADRVSRAATYLSRDLRL
jgi:hypothetical protein